ncbi:MAG: DeoR/GlpR transcriptional regulator [Clostridia bacterium]|nr:DeoR/GlpR transcriptional regulator [Clostridia bacterium]
MLKNQRHFEILEILKNEGFAEVRTLGERLYASQPTIRRDLDFLEKQGYIRRSHGGAVLADDRINTPVSFRRGTKAREKAQICKLAASLIRSGSLIFADASTTAAHLADAIHERDNVTVVTNGYPICRALSEKDIRVFSTGGRLLKNSMAFVGTQAEEAVRKFNAEWLFFSSSSLDENGVISDYSEEETALRIAMRSGARRSVFLCDSTKFGKTSAFRAFTVSEIDYVVTDAPLPQHILNTHGFLLQKSENGAFMYKNSRLV